MWQDNINNDSRSYNLLFSKSLTQLNSLRCANHLTKYTFLSFTYILTNRTLSAVFCHKHIHLAAITIPRYTRTSLPLPTQMRITIKNSLRVSLDPVRGSPLPLFHHPALSIGLLPHSTTRMQPHHRLSERIAYKIFVVNWYKNVY